MDSKEFWGLQEIFITYKPMSGENHARHSFTPEELYQHFAERFRRENEAKMEKYYGDYHDGVQSCQVTKTPLVEKESD